MRHNVFDLGESDVELQVGFVNKISSWVTFVAPHHSILYAYCLALLLVSIKLLEIIRLGRNHPYITSAKRLGGWG